MGTSWSRLGTGWTPSIRRAIEKHGETTARRICEGRPNNVSFPTGNFGPESVGPRSYEPIGRSFDRLWLCQRAACGAQIQDLKGGMATSWSRLVGYRGGGRNLLGTSVRPHLEGGNEWPTREAPDTGILTNGTKKPTTYYKSWYQYPDIPVHMHICRYVYTVCHAV